MWCRGLYQTSICLRLADALDGPIHQPQSESCRVWACRAPVFGLCTAAGTAKRCLLDCAEHCRSMHCTSAHGRLRSWQGSCVCHHIRYQLHLHLSCLIHNITAGHHVLGGTGIREPTCGKGPLHILEVVLSIVALAMYLLPHVWYVQTGSKDLRTMPYSAYRWAGNRYCAYTLHLRKAWIST